MNNKNFANTYLYRRTKQYEKKLINFIMNGERIDKNDKSFEDIKFQVKRRQVTNTLYSVLEDDNVILLHHEEGMPKSFKVFCAKDLKNDGKLKVYIDCSDIMRKSNGIWNITSIDILIAHLVSAMTNYIYYLKPNRLLMSNDLSIYGTTAFSALFTHIIDYMYKISLLESKRDNCIYLSSMYFLVNIMGRDSELDSTKAIAKRISNISDRQIEILEMGMDSDIFNNIKTFIDQISKILKLENLSIDMFIEKWIYLYGTGTHFATEYFPEFSAMLTDTYVGCYINNQKTIEKITNKNMVEFSRVLFRIGEAGMK